MQAIGRRPQQAPDGAPVHYERHRPEQTTLYRLVQQHAASFIAHTEASTGGELPRFIICSGLVCRFVTPTDHGVVSGTPNDVVQHAPPPRLGLQSIAQGPTAGMQRR